MSAGYLAAITFLLFTGSGYLAQVIKLFRRRRLFLNGRLSHDRVCEGLHPTREIISYCAFLLFALSGVTRSYLDLFLFGSRVPVVLLTVIIIWFLYKFEVARGKIYFYLSVLLTGFLCVLTVCIIYGVQLYQTPIAFLVDNALSVVGCLVFYGKLLQARLINSTKSAGAVSLLREGGLLLKDMTGLWYTITVGRELFWVGLTHALSGVASLIVVLAAIRARSR